MQIPRTLKNEKKTELIIFHPNNTQWQKTTLQGSKISSNIVR